jgi:glutathione S-transferase
MTAACCSKQLPFWDGLAQRTVMAFARRRSTEQIANHRDLRMASGTVHPTFKQFIHPEQYAADCSSHTSLKAHAKDSYWGYLQELNTILADRPWIMGNEFTLADPYALVSFAWGREMRLPIMELQNLVAMKDRLIERQQPGALSTGKRAPFYLSD